MTTIYSKAGTDAAIGAATGALGLGTAAQSDATDFAPASSAAYPVQQVTLTGSLAYTLPVDAPADQVISVVFTQDGTGGHTVTYGGQPVTVNAAAGASTTVELVPVGAGFVVRYPSPVTTTALPTLERHRNIGNRIAVLGSSTTRGGDTEPGIGGGLIRYVGDSWYTWAQLFSDGAIQRTVNAGIYGNELAQMDARVEADVIAFVHPKPTACIVYSGYAYEWAPSGIYAKTPAQFIASLDSICNKLLRAGIVPIIATPLPTLGTIATRLHAYAVAEREYTSARGLILLDFWTWATDPATGGLKAEYGATDNTHPSPAGYKILGRQVWEALKPYMPPPSFKPTQLSVADSGNLVPNGLFVGTPTSGRAPSVGVVNTLPAGVTASVVTDLVVGNMQALTLTGAATGEAKLYQRISAGATWSPGDWVEVSGILSADAGVDVDVRLQFNVAPHGNAPIRLLGTGADKVLFHSRFQIPPDIVSHFDVQMSAGSATVAQSGTARWGQLTVRNLTKRGLDPAI